MPIDDHDQVPPPGQPTPEPAAEPQPPASADREAPEDAGVSRTEESSAEGGSPPDVAPADAAHPPVDGERTDDAAGESMTLEDVMDTGPVEPVVSEHLVAVLEALVFASPEPITQKQIFKLLDSEPREDVLAALGELQARYEARGGGLQLVEVAGGYQIVTRPELADSVRRMFHERTTQKLSIAALETLAVIAYKQPITAAEVAEIRSVNTSGVIGTLLERGLIRISGRKQVVGRPFLYSTTREFLDRFGLKDLSDLPKVEDMAGALGFEVPAGLQSEAIDALPLADEPATEEDAAVLSGEDGDEVGGDENDPPASGR